MLTQFTPYLLVVCMVALLTGCGGKSEKEQKDDDDGASVSLGGTLNAVQEMAKQAEEAQKNGPIEVTDFRKLKELLPEEAAGLTRKSATGEKNGMAGVTISTANARYENGDDSQHLDLAVMDTGGTGAMMGLAAWTMIDVDKETETGYERTSKIGDNKTYEKYDNTNKSGEIAMMVKSRFLITIKGKGIEAEQLKQVLESIDTGKLE
jgi:hypothetical protein